MPQRLSAWKNIDGKSRLCLDGVHENKNDWINSGVLLFGSCSVLGGQSADGHLEAKRIEIEDYTRNLEKH
jgi:hypothetical protein